MINPANPSTYPQQAPVLINTELFGSLDIDKHELKSTSFLISAKKLESEMKAIRRAIHANPELAFKEIETAKLAETRLKKLGFTIVQSGIAGSGLIAEIGKGTDVVAIRAEMDAVELDEFNQVVYRSQNRNIMHACGHDAHVAAVLGAAELLAAAKLPGRIRIIMQPAEETADAEGLRGSHHMIANGALAGAKAVLGMHVDATMPFGKIGVIENSLLELESKFNVKIANCPGKTLVPLSLGRLLTQLMEQKSSSLWRLANLQISEVHCCSNEEASVSGYFNADESSNEKLCDELSKTCSTLFQEQFKLAVDSNAAEIDSHKEIIKHSFDAAKETLGNENVIAIRRKSWTKDFAVYAKQTPASFFLLGTAIAGQRLIQHTTTFDLDERSLPIAAAVLAASASKILSESV